MSVVCIYATLIPDVSTMIKLHLLNILFCAGLSYVTMRWLCPTWECVEIKESIETSVKTNNDFLHKITEYFQRKGNLPTSYSVARKEAFMKTSNLSSAFSAYDTGTKVKTKGNG